MARIKCLLTKTNVRQQNKIVLVPINKVLQFFTMQVSSFTKWINKMIEDIKTYNLFNSINLHFKYSQNKNFQINDKNPHIPMLK